LRHALELARSVDDRSLLVRATADLAAALLVTAHIGAALAEMEPLVDAARTVGDDAAANFAAVRAQALMRSARNAEAVEWADIAIPAAERQQLDAIVAQALITKATALVSMGRRREGLALLDGATRFAQDAGINRMALRGHVNLAATSSVENPRVALDWVRSGFALSQRLGIRTYLGYDVGNGYSAALRTGDWAWFEALAREISALAPDPVTLTWTKRCLASIDAWRGIDPGSQFVEAQAEAEADNDPQALAYAVLWLAQVAYVGGDFTRTARLVEDGNPEYWPYVSAFGGRGALLAGDQDGAGRAMEAVARHGKSGALGADLLMLQAGIDALAGQRAQAVGGYRSALARYRELGLRFDLALTTAEAVALVGRSDADLVASADDARQILLELDAGPMVSRLDSVLATTIGRDDRRELEAVR
jgi:hypothetical protein